MVVVGVFISSVASASIDERKGWHLLRLNSFSILKFIAELFRSSFVSRLPAFGHAYRRRKRHSARRCPVSMLSADAQWTSVRMCHPQQSLGSHSWSLCCGVMRFAYVSANSWIWAHELQHANRIATDEVLIVVGTNDLSAGGTKYKVSKVMTHKLYDQRLKPNDIGLVKAKSPIQMGKFVNGIDYSWHTVPANSSLVLSKQKWTRRAENTNQVERNIVIVASWLGSTHSQRRWSKHFAENKSDVN